MRNLILLTLVFVGLSHGMQPGLEYVYDYEGTVYSGIPELKINQVASARLATKVVLQAITADTILAKLASPQVGALNDVLCTSPHAGMPIVTKSLTDGSFEKTFIINVHQGGAMSFNVPADEPVWITNIRKSVVHMLRVAPLDISLMKSQVQVSEATFDFKMTMFNGTTNFETMEDSLAGTCNTMYTMSPLPEDLAAREAWISKSTIEEDVQLTVAANIPSIKEEYWNVQRATDFHKCNKKVFLKRDGTPLDCKPGLLMCEPETERSSVGTYVLRGSLGGMRIERAMTEGSISFRALDQTSEYIHTFTNQTLLLKAVKEIGQEMTVDSTLKPIDSFHFEYNPMPQGSTREATIEELVSAVKVNPDNINRAKVNVVKHILDKAAFVNDRILENSVVQPHIDHLHDVANAISMMDVNDIRVVYEQIAQGSTYDADMVAMKLFTEVLLMAGSEASIHFLYELLDSAAPEQRDAMLHNCAMSILDISSTQILPPVMELIFNKLSFAGMNGESFAKSIAMINLGSVIQRLCVKPRSSEEFTPKCDTEAILNTFIPFMADSLKTEDEVWKQTVIVQALANLGHNRIIEVLRPMLLGTVKFDVRVRNIALWAMNSDTMPKGSKIQITNLLTTIFANQAENFEIRGNAFLVLHLWMPHLAWWQKIALSTWREPSNQVAALITHTLATRSMEDSKMGRIAKLCLPLAKPAPAASLLTSFSKNIITYLSMKTPMSFSILASLANTAGLVPKQLYFMLQNSFLNPNYYSYNFAIQSQGIEEFINRLSILLKNSNTNSSVQRGVMKSARALYDQIKETLGAEMKHSPEKLEIIIWAQFFRSFQFVLPIIADIDDPISMLQRLQTAQHKFHYQLFKEPIVLVTAFPTDLGLPHLLQLKTPSITFIKGTVSTSADNLENISLDINLSLMHNTKVKVMSTTALPWANHYVAAGVDHVQSFTLPLKLSMNLNLPKTLIQTTLKSKGDKVEILGVTNTPYTAVMTTMPLMTDETSDFKSLQVNDIPYYAEKDLLGKVGLAANLEWKGDFEDPFTFRNIYHRVARMSPIPSVSGFISNTLRMWSMKVLLDNSASTTKGITLNINYITSEKSSSSISTEYETEQALSIHKIQQNYQFLPDGKIHSVQVNLEFLGSAPSTYKVVASKTTLPISAKPTTNTKYQISLINNNSEQMCLNVKAISPTMVPLTQYKNVISQAFENFIKIEYLEGEKCQGSVPIAKINAEFSLSAEKKRQLLEEINSESALVSDSTLERTFAPYALYDQWKATVSFDNAIPVSLKKQVYNFEDLFFGSIFPDVSYISTRNPEGQIAIEASSDVYKKWQTIIKSPNMMAIWKNSWGLSSLLKPYYLVPQVTTNNVENFGIRYAAPVACSISQTKVSTFDGLDVPTRGNTCWTVAVMSLNEARTPFAVQVKNKAPYEARIILPDEGIVIQASNKQVMVNGNVLQVNNEETHLSDSSWALSLPDGIIVVAGNGVIVKVTDKVHIMAPGLYRSQVGGVCGDNNGELTSDLTGPKNCVYTRAELFTSAWSVKDSTCTEGADFPTQQSVKDFQMHCPRPSGN